MKGDDNLKELEIYRLLPKKNCKKCSPGTCIAFAVHLRQDISILGDCPYLDPSVREYIERHLNTADWRDQLIERLKKDVSMIPLHEVAPSLGAAVNDEGIVIRCIGIEYLIKEGGMILPPIDNKWIKILLLHYLKSGGRGEFTGEWVQFSELKGGLVKASTFQRDCEVPLCKLFDEKQEEMVIILKRLGAIPVEGYPSEISMVIDLLPKIRCLILYSRGDDELPSSIKILFDRITERFLDVESLIFLFEGLIHTIKHMFLSDIQR